MRLHCYTNTIMLVLTYPIGYTLQQLLLTTLTVPAILVVNDNNYTGCIITWSSHI